MSAHDISKELEEWNTKMRERFAFPPGPVTVYTADDDLTEWYRDQEAAEKADAEALEALKLAEAQEAGSPQQETGGGSVSHSEPDAPEEDDDDNDNNEEDRRTEAEDASMSSPNVASSPTIDSATEAAETEEGQPEPQS